MEKLIFDTDSFKSLLSTWSCVVYNENKTFTVQLDFKVWAAEFRNLVWALKWSDRYGSMEFSLLADLINLYSITNDEYVLRKNSIAKFDITKQIQDLMKYKKIILGSEEYIVEYDENTLNLRNEFKSIIDYLKDSDRAWSDEMYFLNSICKMFWF